MRKTKQQARPSYSKFIESKRRDWSGCGIEPGPMSDGLFPWQARVTAWALRKGRAAIWADTGLGKTRMQAAWAAQIPGKRLILAPLCVADQTIREAGKIGVPIAGVGLGAEIEITNYEQIHNINPDDYSGVVLDESSILKSIDGKTRTRLIAMFKDTPYRLCCTATPAPNDIAELANHCEFLGIMTRPEMLATFFVHDDEGWRLKRHAKERFFQWLATWGLFFKRPSDLGFPDDGYILPPLNVEQVTVESEWKGETLFPGFGLGGIRGRLGARRASLGARIDACVEMVAASPDQWIVWCGLDVEQTGVAGAISDCVSVHGSDSPGDKANKIQLFIRGDVRVLVSKVKIAGFGLNLQNCHNMAFLGIGDSYETYYQAIRRCYRFGQTHPVNVKIIVSEAEEEIVRNVKRKEKDAADMTEAIVKQMRDAELEEIGMTERKQTAHVTETATGEGWELRLGDCVEEMTTIEPDSVDLSIYSPPFQSLYTYSASERDIGNSSSRAEFLEHMGYCAEELFRVTKPGRHSACHVQQVASTLTAHGQIGLFDLRGDLIRLYESKGWIYHGEICIDKDPQAQAIRTKSKALLFVQLRKDASWLRPALADYIVLFRKPGENAVPIHPDITNEEWIEWARPIWYNIRESDTLNVREARANEDERHICPLQLGTIERCVRLWSNPGETVLSPFAGIGSEGYVSVRNGRRFIGFELKEEYFRAASRNIASAVGQDSLFGNVREG